MTLYCESSAIVSVFLREQDRHATVQGEIEREPVVSSQLSYIEVRSTLVRAGFRVNPRRLTTASYNRAVREFESDWPNYVRLPVTEELLEMAANLARTHLLRAYDAVHLATAMTLTQHVPDRLLVSTWDKELASAATVEGLALAHEVPT